MPCRSCTFGSKYQAKGSAPHTVYITTARGNGRSAASRLMSDYLDMVYECDYMHKEPNMFEIKRVIFSYPVTVVLWADGTKTLVRCQDGDVFDPEKGLAMAISKKALGNTGEYFETFKEWIEPEEAKSLYPGLAEAMSVDLHKEAHKFSTYVEKRLEEIRNKCKADSKE